MKVKKIVGIIICFALVLSCAFPAVGLVDESYAAKGSGVSIQASTGWYTGSGPYTLSNKEDMLGLVDLVNAGTDFSGKTITLGSNLAGLSIAPIGTPEHPFNGTFDGNGKTLEGLQITTSRKQYVGLFGVTGAGSVIKNLRLSGGTLAVTDGGEQIRYVGAIAGYAAGGIDNCYSNMDVNISSSLALGTNKGIIRDVGGLVGYIAGNMTKCEHGGDIYISSASNINDDVRYLVGEVGGLAGAQGDVMNPAVVPLTEDCENTGDFIFNVTGAGGVDRFGQPLLSVSYAVGGIIGQASGRISKCTNSGTINTSNGTAEHPEAGRGAENTGGIVGSLRGISFEKNSVPDTNLNASKIDPAYEYYRNNGGAGNKPASLPPAAGVYDCTNTGAVIGLAAVGGIVGNGGTFTEIEGCANTGVVKGCRWNKPFAGGIAGNIQGNVRCSYNRGDIYSVTGGGYYCAGIAGGLWTVNTILMSDNERAPTTEMTGCYTTGRIYTDAAGFRTGILAGENESFIHDNVYLSGLSLDGKMVETDSGTTVDNASVSQDDLKAKTGSKARGILNTYAAGKGGWDICYLPDVGNVNGGYPVLSPRGVLSISGAVPIPAGSVPSLAADAEYAPGSDPVPKIKFDLAGGGELVQNSDFRVRPQSGARAVTADNNGAGPKPYEATIEGIGSYKDDFATKVPYGIAKAKLSACTIVSETVIFNWQRQSPVGRTKLIDSVGNEVNASEYEVSDLYDGNSKGINVNPNGAADIRFYDYTNVHGRYYNYDVKVAAKSTSPNYIGSTIQPAFRINTASLQAQLPASDPLYDKNLPERSVFGDVTWQGKRWDFIKAMRDETGKTVQITYTGKPITPTVSSIKYLGQELRLATNFDYQSRPLDYDYKYIYGNPNPAADGGNSEESIDVTTTPACMTVRYTNGGNFDNYENVFFTIVPAAISKVKVSIPAKAYTGKALKPKLKFEFGDLAPKKGKDYTISPLKWKSNKNIGKATVKFTISGKGNFSGKVSKTVTFKINPKSTKISKLTVSKAVGKRKMKVSFKKVSKVQKVTSYQVSYRAKKSKKWKTVTVSAKKSSVTLKSLKKGKKYEVRVRAVKKIAKGASKGKYYGAWSKIKTGKKVK